MQNLVFLHTELNPHIFDEGRLRPEVRLALMKIALDFYRFLEVDVPLSSVVLTGSNAAYNYGPTSDIDLHLVIDTRQIACDDVMRQLFHAKKSLWNTTHDVFIKGHPVEVYVEEYDRRSVASGGVDILNGVWIKTPSVPPAIAVEEVAAKALAIAETIDAMIGDADSLDLKTFVDDLREKRKAALDAGGEFSEDNLIFKTLRAWGYLDLLHAKIHYLENKRLTLEGK